MSTSSAPPISARGHVALGILDFARHHAEIVPSIVSPERGNRGHAESRQQAAVPTRREERVKSLPRAVTVGEAQHDEDGQHQQLGGGEESLYGAAAAHAQNVQPGKQQHHQGGAKLEAGQTQIRSRGRRNWREAPQTVSCKRGKKVSEVEDKPRGDGGNRGGLGDDELRPAVEESEQRAVSAVHVNEFAARLRHRRAEFGIASAPKRLRTPAATNTSSTIDGVPTCCSMMPGTTKIAVPIIVPATTEVAPNTPRPFTNSV